MEMDKKNRTGLQSKISQIFAGVPMPRKKRSLSENPPPENKVENPDLLQVPQNQTVIEPNVVEPPPPLPDENIIDLSLDEEPVVEQIERKSADETIQAGPPVDSLENLLSPQPSPVQPLESPKQVKKPLQPEQKVVKPEADMPIPAPPVKEPGVEKTLPVSSQKPPVGKIPRIEAVTKKDMALSRKVTPKLAAKQLKVKTGAGKPRQKTMAALVIALSILLVVVLGVQFGVFSSSDSSRVIEQPLPNTKIIKNTGGITIDWQQPPAYPDGIRDPMVLGKDVKTGTEKRDFTVKGISQVDGQYLALIGTDLLKVGDEIYGAKIKNINGVQVEFERDGVTWTQAVGE